MKNWFPIALFLAVLAAGIFLLWIDYDPSIVPAKRGNAEELSQPGSEESKRPFDPSERVATSPIATRSQNSRAAEDASPFPADIPASNRPETEKISNDTSSFPDYEDPEETEDHFIGGHVQDEDGNPLSSIEVVAERVAETGEAVTEVDLAIENTRSIFTDYHGAFLFSDLGEGEYQVRLAPIEGIAPAQTTVRAGTLNVKLVVVEMWNLRVYGTVSSSDDTPIKNVHIIVGPTTRNTTSGAKGEYELDVTMRGNNVVHTMHFQHKDFRHQVIRFDPAELDDLTRDFQLDVSMEPLKKLTTVIGSLVDTQGNPVGGKALNIVTSQMQTLHRTQSYDSGIFLFEEVEPGNDYQLLIRPGSGYKNKDINPLVVPDEGLNLDIVLEPAEHGELSGWMIDPSGNPVPGFNLTLHSTIATGQSVSVTSDQQGFFFVEGFPVGGAMFRTSSYPVLSVHGIRVTPEPEDPVTVVLDMGRNVLQGSVINGFGEPVAAASVSLVWEFRDRTLLNTSSRKTITDQNGSFVFTGVGSDLHTMEVSAPGFGISVLSINVGIDPNEIVIELEEVEVN